MNDPDADREDVSRESTRAFDSLGEENRTLFLAKLALKLGYRVGDLKAVSEAIDAARREVENS